MSSPMNFSTIEGRNVGAWVILLAFGGLAGLGGLAALYMEHNGHWVTGMNNQVVWGLPHVVAVFLIVAASGALNVASIGSVFGKEPYKPMARLSCLLAGALMAGGLAVLLLDLGRSDRLMVAMTYYNFTSIFALNIFFYSGFFSLVIAYVWTMMDDRVAFFYKPVAVAAFCWRLALTTGTGSIFGFLISRSAYHSAAMAPMFIALSLSCGLAAFVIVMLFIEACTGRAKPSPELLRRMRVLLAVLTAVALYFVFALHLTNYYSAERRDVERFLLFDGGLFTTLLWLGFVCAGSFFPIGLLLGPWAKGSRLLMALASAAVLAGGLSLMYVIIIGGQVYPIEIFPGKIVTSSFFDGVVSTYMPSLPEFVLAAGGVGIAGLIVTVVLWALPMLPDSHQAAE